MKYLHIDWEHPVYNAYYLYSFCIIVFYFNLNKVCITKVFRLFEIGLVNNSSVNPGSTLYSKFKSKLYYFQGHPVHFIRTKHKCASFLKYENGSQVISKIEYTDKIKITISLILKHDTVFMYIVTLTFIYLLNSNKIQILNESFKGVYISPFSQYTYIPYTNKTSDGQIPYI